MILRINNYFKNNKIENIIFEIGIFLLVTVPSISGIFLFISMITGSFGRKDSYLKDKWNYAFLIALLLIILNLFTNIGDNNQAIYASLNLIPYFYLFWAFKKFLYSEKLRKRCAVILILGTIPFLLGGILQVGFNVYGPLSLFDGFFIWFQREGEVFTSAFNNANYASIWLSLILPFCYAGLFTRKNYDLKRILILLITILCIAGIIFTYSRNGLISILLISTFMINFKSKIAATIPLLLIIITFIVVTISLTFGFEIPLLNNLIKKLNPVSLLNLNNLTRVKILKSTLLFISQKPLLGWGAATFPIIYNLNNIENTNYSFQHTHNLFLEIAYNYGIPVSILVFGTIFLLLYKSRIDINSKNILYEKAWRISAIIFLIFSQFDVPYYDFRISALFWILISGISCFKYDYKKIEIT